MAAGDEAPAVPCEPETVPGGLTCLADGESLWAIEHPGMWEEPDDYPDPDRVDTPVGPLALGDAFYYAVGRDLMEVDLVEQAVVDRTRFPAHIETIAVDGDRFEITVRDVFDEEYFEDPPTDDEITLVAIPYRPGQPAPPQHLWSFDGFYGFLGSDRDASIRRQSDLSPQESLQSMESAAARDHTNPHLLVTLGEMHRDADDEQAAQEAFDDAAATPNAVWRDLIAASSRLESAGASEAADRAFERGLRKMEETGVSPDRIGTTVAFISILMADTGEDSPMGRAIASGNMDDLDRLARRQAAVAPHVEFGAFAWSTLANWLEAEGEEQLADDWRMRADQNREQTEMFFQASGIDRGLLALGSGAIGLILILWLVGLRTGATSGSGRWIPKLRKRDLLAPLLLLALLLALPYQINTHVDAISTQAMAPAAPVHDGLAAPHSIYWLESLAESEARDSLLETARAEQESIRHGEAIAHKAPVTRDIVDAIYADARQEQLEYISQYKIPNFAYGADAISAGRAPVASDRGASYGLFSSIGILLVGAAIILYVGFLFGRFLPGLAGLITLVIPGGSRHLAPLGAAALVILIAAIAALLGLGHILQTLSKPGFLNYFGFQALSDFSPSPSQLWAWIALGMVAVYQGVMITWTLRSAPGVDDD